MDPPFSKSRNCVFSRKKKTSEEKTNCELKSKQIFFFSILCLVIMCSVDRLLGINYHALYSIIIIIDI